MGRGYAEDRISGEWSCDTLALHLFRVSAPCRPLARDSIIAMVLLSTDAAFLAFCTLAIFSFQFFEDGGDQFFLITMGQLFS